MKSLTMAATSSDLALFGRETVGFSTPISGLEKIPLPNVRRPDRMPSLPAWLQQRIDALGSAVQPDNTGKHREMVVLPSSMILNAQERVVVEQHIVDLERLFDLEQPITLREQTLSNEHANGPIIAHILIKGGAKLDETSSDALTEDYLDAIEDLPAWLVRAALRKWNRAESAKIDGRPNEFNYRPAPPTLRRLALIECTPIKDRVVGLKKLLRAVPRTEFSEEHRARILSGFTDLGKLLRAM